VVHLNTATELQVAFTSGARRLVLVRGEAQFDVMHDAGRPFLVRVGGRTIRAVGTAFNVRLSDGKVEVLVTEGRVAIADSTSSATTTPPRAIEVSAGELAALGEAQPEVTQTQPADANARLAWQRGLIVFRGEPLASALEEVERYTPVRFELADPELGKLRIGGYYKIGDVEGLQRSLIENFPLAISREGDRVIIRAVEAR
jgi:transmembrane sensor